MTALCAGRAALPTARLRPSLAPLLQLLLLLMTFTGFLVTGEAGGGGRLGWLAMELGQR